MITLATRSHQQVIVGEVIVAGKNTHSQRQILLIQAKTSNSIQV